MMKAIILAPYPPLPPRGGGQQRMYHLIRGLAERHEIHLLTFSPGDAATAALMPLQSICRSVTVVPSSVRGSRERLRTTLLSPLPDILWRGHSPRLATALDRLLATVNPDIIQAESIEMTQYAPQQHGKRDEILWVYDSFNVEYRIQRGAFLTDVRHPRRLPVAGYSLIQWRKLVCYERLLHDRFDGAFVVSEGDRRLMASLDPTLPTALVPNGVDTTFYEPRQITDARPVVLFTGTLDYRPNIDALVWFATEVWPYVLGAQAEARFVIVGRNPIPAVIQIGTQAGIDVEGEVEDVRPFFRQAAVYVVPMRIGGGVRLKVLEAFAQAMPVVSTSLGVEGIDGVTSGHQARIADEAHAFAAAILDLLADPATGASMGRAARRLVVEGYDWQAIVPRVEDAWLAWLHPHKPTQPR